MPKIAYVAQPKFSAATLNIIETANNIITEYQGQGFDLTLRQLYYQFVARGLIPNKQTEYKRIGDILNNGRLAGLVDWEAIVDRTRHLRTLSTWNTPASVLCSAARSFRLDKWREQPTRVEVWIEKDALVGVIEGVCNQLEVPYFSCRGYVSQSEMWAAGQRVIDAYRDREQPTVIIHLGDHDPSGIDMTRDIRDRIELFASIDYDWPKDIFSVERVALNMEQVRKYDPPPNPAKLTDSRCHNYMQVHGNESWELDALDPKLLYNLIRDKVFEYRDAEIAERVTEEEDEEKETLRRIASNYAGVKRYVEGA